MLRRSRDRKKLILGLILVTVLGLLYSTGATGMPDIEVNDLTLNPPNPAPGNEVQITASIINSGDVSTDRFYVSLYIDGTRIKHKIVSFGLDPDESRSVVFSWFASAGEHDVKIVADRPFDRVDESNEENNSLQRFVNVIRRPTSGASQDITIAVARFEDQSNSGFANISNGLADMLIEKMVNNGFRVVERGALESLLQEQQFTPTSTSDLAKASRFAGADALLVGSVNNIDISTTKINLGFFSTTGANVKVDISYRLISSYTSEILSADSVTAGAEGQTNTSVEIGTFLNTISQVSTNVCAGGFRTNKSNYYQGELITVGYRDPNPPSQYTIQFYGPSGPLGPSMWANAKSSSPGNPCVTWNWNSSALLGVGNYHVELYTWPPSSFLASRSFRVSAGSGPPTWVSEITVGSKQFQDTIVGDAVNKAINSIVSDMATELDRIGPRLQDQRQQFQEPQQAEQETQEPAEQIKCRVIAEEQGDTVILGGIDGDCGAADGVKEDQLFLIFPAKTVTNPSTGELIEIIPQQDQPKGKVIIINVFDKLARAQKIGQFEINVDDLAIKKPDQSN